MIFKTITESSTGAIKSVSLFGNKIVNIKKVFSSIKAKGLKNTIFNESTIDQKAINEYNAAIRKGIDPQIALSNASANTNKATIALMQSANGTKVSTDALTSAQKSSTLAARAGQAALKSVALAGSMLAGIGISIVFDKIAESINNYLHRVDRAKDSLYDFCNTTEEQQNNLTSQKEWIAKNGNRYSELASGVDEYGHSISLTKNEIEEYNSLTREIAEMFPNMIKGYNDQDQAIIKTKGNVNALTKSYEENVKAYYTSIRSKSGDTFSNYKTAISKSQKTRNQIDSILNTNHNISIDTIDNWVRNLGDGFDKTTKAKIQDELMKMDKNIFGTNISFRLSDFSEGLQQKILDVYSNAQNTIDTETEKVRPILEAFLYSNTSGYDTLDTDAQNAVQNFIRNINSTFYSSFDKDTDLQMWIRQNVINPLQDDADFSDIAIQFETMNSDKYISQLSEDDLHALYYQFNPKNKTSLDEMESFLEKKQQKYVNQIDTNKLSFESWNALGSTEDDDNRQAAREAKEQLLELANTGRLTAEELQNSPAGQTIMEQTKLSAEEATEAVNALADRISQLSTMKSGIQSISYILAQNSLFCADLMKIPFLKALILLHYQRSC